MANDGIEEDRCIEGDPNGAYHDVDDRASVDLWPVLIATTAGDLSAEVKSPTGRDTTPWRPGRQGPQLAVRIASPRKMRTPHT